MGTRTCAGAWSIDLPGVSGKAPAGDFSRRLVTSTPTTTISTPTGRAFPLPSRSTLNVYSTPRYFSPRKPCITRQCACDSAARRLLTAASVNDGRTAVRPLQTERSTSDADDNRTASYAPPTARFTELGMSVSLPIFIQLRKDNGRRRTSHSCQDTIRPDANPVTAKRPYRCDKSRL